MPASFARRVWRTFRPLPPKPNLATHLPITAKDIVLLGDSLIAYGEWAMLLGTHHARNRGVSGNRVADILARVDGIVAGQPAHVVLCVGVNDIQQRTPLAEIVAGFETLFTRFTEESPFTHLWLVPVLPANLPLYRRHLMPHHPRIGVPTVEAVEALNAALAPICARYGVGVLDCSCLLLGGTLRADCTADGLHPNATGLVALADVIRLALAHGVNGATAPDLHRSAVPCR
jgi:lysophospholipase L1-like esterase